MVGKTLSDSEKIIEIDIKALDTPAGPVPTIEAVKQIIGGLNVLNDEMIKNKENINNEVLKIMESVERELKSLKKLLAEETISFSALKESVSTIQDRIEKSVKKDQNNYDRLEKSINELNQTVKNFENNLESKIYAILRKIIKPKSKTG